MTGKERIVLIILAVNILVVLIYVIAGYLRKKEKKFSIAMNLAWKVMKDIIVGYYEITDFVTGSPKEVLKKAFQAKLISDDTWLEMLRTRNELAHDYDGAIIKSACMTIIGRYLDLFYDFRNTVDELLKESL